MADDIPPKDPRDQKAAALTYSKNKQAAPRLSAKGRGWLAAKIMEVAKEHDIPLHRDPDLMAVLDTLEVDEEIPLEVYAVVAEIFAYLYRTGKARQTETA